MKVGIKPFRRVSRVPDAARVGGFLSLSPGRQFLGAVLHQGNYQSPKVNAQPFCVRQQNGSEGVGIHHATPAGMAVRAVRRRAVRIRTRAASPRVTPQSAAK